MWIDPVSWFGTPSPFFSGVGFLGAWKNGPCDDDIHGPPFTSFRTDFRHNKFPYTYQ
jgi:hypothetical protein